jgi:hypothetical protein
MAWVADGDIYYFIDEQGFSHEVSPADQMAVGPRYSPDLGTGRGLDEDQIRLALWSHNRRCARQSSSRSS